MSNLAKRGYKKRWGDTKVSAVGFWRKWTVTGLQINIILATIGFLGRGTRHLNLKEMFKEKLLTDVCHKMQKTALWENETSSENCLRVDRKSFCLIHGCQKLLAMILSLKSKVIEIPYLLILFHHFTTLHRILERRLRLNMRMYYLFV